MVDNIVIQEGIINPDLWKQSKYKVLFILKESYGTLSVEGESTYSLPKHLNYNGAYGHTFTACNNFLVQLISDNNCYNKELIKSSAIINIIKTYGENTTTSWKELRKNYELNKKLLKEQIENIDPNIIVFGNTYYLFHEDYAELPSLEYNKTEIVEDDNSIFNNKIVCNCYHPSIWCKYKSQLSIMLEKIIKILERKNGKWI